jgi:hypothetical protein
VTEPISSADALEGPPAAVCSHFCTFLAECMHISVAQIVHELLHEIDDCSAGKRCRAKRQKITENFASEPASAELNNPPVAVCFHPQSTLREYVCMH